MQTATLGATGIKVSRFCLGAMMLGGIGNPDHEDCARIIYRAIDVGINFIDTADVYGRGESETIVGKAIKGKRAQLVIATKFGLPMSDTDPSKRGGSRRWIIQAVEDSLHRLGSDYIDLYQMHRYDETTYIGETLFTLTELVRQGKVRAFGSSMFPADRIVESQWVAEKRGLLGFRTEQPWYSIFSREIERFVLPTARRYGMGVLTWSPLDAGFLAGKYRSPNDLTDDTRIARVANMFRGSFDPRADFILCKLEVIPELERLAEEAGITLAQLAVAFTLEHPDVTATIIGPHKLEHLESLLPAADLRLDPAILDRIDALAPPGSLFNLPNDIPAATTPAHIRRPR
ncbi:MAG: aldo/keto reductase [Candidatus Latescibacterota bacterium]